MPGLVHFPSHSPITMTARPPHPDEADVMYRFANHAARCKTCADPYHVYTSGGTLCRRGHGHAREVSEYVYSKGGKAMSVLERADGGSRVMIEIPRGCEAVRGLLRAVAEGLEIHKVRKPREVVVRQDRQDRTYDVAERRPREEREKEKKELVRERERAAAMIEVARRRDREARRGRERERDYDPRRTQRYYRGDERREDRRTSYVPGRGSLYLADAEERRRGGPIIIVDGNRKYHR